MIGRSGKLMRALAAGLLLFVTGGAALAQNPQVIYKSGKAEFGRDLAVGGFDSVAYHTQRVPVRGTPSFRVSWRGAEWRFSTAANRDAFVKEPSRYAPQFGGYCALAAAYGQKAPGDPRVFRLVNGKLYLNRDTSAQSQWDRDQANLIRQGEQKWPSVR